MGGRRRRGDRAVELRVGDPRRQRRERLGRIVARLPREAPVVDRAAIQPRRRAGLQTAEREARPREALREAHRGRVAEATGRPALPPEMDLAAQEGAGGQHHGARAPGAPVGRQDAADRAARVEQQVVDGSLGDREVRLPGEQRADGLAIERAVGLRPRPAHGRALAAVEDAELDAGAVDRARHQAVERIDLAHEVAAAEAADRRVAGHRADGLPLVGQQQRARADPGARGGRLAAGMAAADDDHVVSRHGAMLSCGAGRPSIAICAQKANRQTPVRRLPIIADWQTAGRSAGALVRTPSARSPSACGSDSRHRARRPWRRRGRRPRCAGSCSAGPATSYR